MPIIWRGRKLLGKIEVATSGAMHDAASTVGISTERDSKRTMAHGANTANGRIYCPRRPDPNNLN